jgi:hypothetical protein
VKMHADVDRLLVLRRRSERIALDEAMRQETQLRTAERSSAEAERKVSGQIAASRAAERELTDTLIGRAVSANVIARLQMDLDAMQAQTDDLKTVATAARSAAAESKAVRDAASERFRLRQRDVARLELLARRIKDRHGRFRRAMDEAIEEDLAAVGQANFPVERG